MELVRDAVNPWGQSVLVGIGWDLMWLALILGGIFIVGHAIWAKVMVKTAEPAPAPGGAGVPEKVQRHSLASRIFHWSMSITMLALLVTAFGPVMGWQFAWLSIHWIAGVLLIVTIVYHVIHVLGRKTLMSMWIGKDDIAQAKVDMKQVIGGKDKMPKAAKYPYDHKMFHHAASVAGLAAIVTGILMLFRIDTVFWQRHQYFLSDATWGIVYVVHGLSGVALITLVIAHIYFAIRPDKWWITKSMVVGWITREKYLEHHDPSKWQLDGAPKAVSDAASVPKDQPVASV